MATVKVKFRASSVPGKEGTLYYHLFYKRFTIIGFKHMCCFHVLRRNNVLYCITCNFNSICF